MFIFLTSPFLTSPLIQATAVVGWLGLVGGFSVVAGRLGYGVEVTRKIVHIGAGHVILLAWWLAIPAWAGIAASILFGGVALLSYWLPILPGINSIGRKSLGTFFYAVSVGVLVAWFWPIDQPRFGSIGILVMCWGDGLAALIGQRWGRHPYQLWGERKSLEGSATMASASFLVVGLVLLAVQGPHWQTWAVALTVAIAATGLESLSKLGIDNLTVPLGAAAVAYYCSLLWS